MSDLSKISDEELMKIANIQNVSDDELMKIAGVDQPQQSKSTLPFNPPRKAVIGAEGANKGIANMLGMPVDIINTAISPIASLFGVTPSDKPVGGSEWFKEKILPPQTLKPEGFVENVLGATFEQIPYAIATALSGGAGILSKAGKPLQSFMQVARPTVGAGIGVGAAREYIPDSPTAEMAGALVGSATPMVTRPLMSWMQPQGRKLVESAMKIPPRSVPKEIRDQAVDTFIKEDISLSEKGLRKVGNLIDDINTEIDDTIKAIPQTKTVKTVIPGKTVTYTIPGKIVKTESSKFAKNEGDPLWRMKSGGDLEEFKRMYTPMAQRPPKDIITQLPDEIITNKIGTIDTTEAAARIDDLKTFYRKLPKDVADEFINVLDDWQAKLASDGFITPEKAQEMKKAIYVLNRKHYGELKSAQVEAHKAFARGLKEELVKQNPQLATLNARDSALINLEEILENALNRTRNYDIIRMGDTLMAMTGGVVGGYPGAGLAAMLKRIFEDPQAKAALGKAMAKAGKKPIPVPFVRAGIAAGAAQNYRSADE